MSMLEGKVAIVSGAGTARGIGFAAARALAKYGAKVVLTDIAENPASGAATTLEERAAELQASDTDAIWAHVDVGSEAEIRAAVDLATERFGGVDILFNNAGVTAGYGPFLGTDQSAWDLQFKIHVSGVAQFCKAVIPSMQARGGGAIINTSSIWAIRAHAGASIYSTTKLGIVALTKAIAVEHGKDSIRCNAILPGPIRTEMQDRRVKREAELYQISEEEARSRLAAPLSLGRVGEPEEIGETVAFLASPMASFITGVALRVDGGEQGGL